MTLSVRRLRGVERLAGPLLVVRRVPGVALGEEVLVRGRGGAVRHGQVLELDAEALVVQVYEGTAALDLGSTVVVLFEPDRVELAPLEAGQAVRMGQPIPPIVPLRSADVNGRAINPSARASPEDFIETGISAIDLLDSLVRGQKLPIFTGAGLPADELAARIATGARVLGEERFVTIFAAMGTPRRVADFFRAAFESSGSLDRVALFLNLADDPAIERLLTPRCALTLAEHLAFDLGMQVLVVMTDVTNYGEALRELATAREEVPGRRGYPGYLYTDLATLFERAGRVHGRPGSLTVLPIVTMPDDDITHPIPDLTGYITEGQIVLSRELHGRAVFPPIDALPCLSRLMNAGIGEGKTRPEHRAVADQLVVIVLHRAVARPGRPYVGGAALFETRFVGQGATRRSLDETFALAWQVLGELPREELIRVPTDVLDRFWRPANGGAANGRAREGGP